MGRITVNDLIALLIAGVMAGILLPIGLTGLVNIANANVTVGTEQVAFSTIAPSSILVLIGTVVPLVMVISVVRGFLKGSGD